MGFLVGLLAVLATATALVAPPAAIAAEPARTGAHAFAFEAIEGHPMPLAQYAGKAMLVVNTASFCGYTPQYQGLQALWERYESRGLVVIGVPSNDFGGQEPKAEAEIQEFCEGAYGITFPLTAKYPVKGPDAHPFYRWASAEGGMANAPRWNFHKYLIGRDGRYVTAFGSGVRPESPELTQAVERALAAKATTPEPGA